MPTLIAWWTRDVARLAPDAHPTELAEAGADLLRRWGEPHRRYHTTSHLVELFWALEELEDGGAIDARAAAVGRVAGWFHDAVYNVPDASDNERRSAAIATAVLPRLGLGGGDVEAVGRLIQASERHELPAVSGLPAAFHDADLWILSADPQRFDAYCTQVREEYAQVPDPAYAQGRGAILRPFLDRPRIYGTDHAHGEWGARARSNVRRELDRLS